MNLNLHQFLFERELNLRRNQISNQYSCSIINKFYSSYSFLYKHDITPISNSQTCVSFSQDGNYIVSGGECIQLWNFNQILCKNFKPQNNYKEKGLKICSVDFNNDTTKIISATLTKKIIVDDISTSAIDFTFLLKEIIFDKSISFTNNNLIAYSDELNMVKILDLRNRKSNSFLDPFIKEKIYSIQFHPTKSYLLLLSQGKNVFTFDIRNSKPSFIYNILPKNTHVKSFARFNKYADKIFCLTNGDGPVLFDVSNSNPIFQFDNYGYFDNLSLKKCCFAGPNDEYVISGSDDYNIYVWKIPKKHYSFSSTELINSAKFILKGHRTCPYDLSYNYQRSVIASTGTGIIFWSPIPFYPKSQPKQKIIDRREHFKRYLNLSYIPQPFIIRRNPFIFDIQIENPFFLTRYDIDNIVFSTMYFLRHRFNRINYVHKDYNENTENLFTQFKEDESFYKIKLLLINNRHHIFVSPELIQEMKIETTRKKTNMRQRISLSELPFIFETKKFYETWNYICYLILYLLRQNILIDKSIKNLDFQDKESLKKKEALLKIKIIINMMNCFLFKCYIKTRDFYSELIGVVKHLFSETINYLPENLIRRELSLEIKKFLQKKDFSLENNNQREALYNNKIKNNKLFDEELALSSLKLKKRFDEHFIQLRKLKEENVTKLEFDLDSLLDYFCSLNHE